MFLTFNTLVSPSNSCPEQVRTEPAKVSKSIAGVIQFQIFSKKQTAKRTNYQLDIKNGGAYNSSNLMSGKISNFLCLLSKLWTAMNNKSSYDGYDQMQLGPILIQQV